MGDKLLPYAVREFQFEQRKCESNCEQLLSFLSRKRKESKEESRKKEGELVRYVSTLAGNQNVLDRLRVRRTFWLGLQDSSQPTHMHKLTYTHIHTFKSHFFFVTIVLANYCLVPCEEAGSCSHMIRACVGVHIFVCVGHRWLRKTQRTQINSSPAETVNVTLPTHTYTHKVW